MTVHYRVSYIKELPTQKKKLPLDGLMENAVPFSSTMGDQENSAEKFLLFNKVTEPRRPA